MLQNTNCIDCFTWQIGLTWDSWKASAAAAGCEPSAENHVSLMKLWVRVQLAPVYGSYWLLKECCWTIDLKLNETFFCSSADFCPCIMQKGNPLLHDLNRLNKKCKMQFAFETHWGVCVDFKQLGFTIKVIGSILIALRDLLKGINYLLSAV